MLIDFRDNVQKCHEYIHALEEEKIKIQVFQRELPLCVELVTQAIEACKQQLSGSSNGHSECSEQTTSNGPVLEEFMPLKRSNSTDDDHHHQDEENHDDDDDQDEDDDDSSDDDKVGKKSDWLRSVQLWNQTPDQPTTHKENQAKRVSVVEIRQSTTGGAFHPFKKEKTSTSGNNINNNNDSKPSLAPAGSGCSSGEVAGDGGGKKEDRKARRCWSPELHRRFLHALHQLGGSHVATPKQIKEMMKVDGLTNDEVKSHLQKYRLHTRRPAPNTRNMTTTQTPQFVIVGGIWVPAAAAVGPSNGEVYAIPTPPSDQSQSRYCEERGNHSKESRRATTATSSSPSATSSSHTTTSSNAN